MANRDYHKAYKREYLKLNKALSVTIPTEAYDELARRADAWGMKPTSLFRDLALSKLNDDAFQPELVAAELKELRFLLHNIANNVNQMAHYSNSLRVMVDERGLLQELRRLEEAINDFTRDRLRADNDH